MSSVAIMNPRPCYKAIGKITKVYVRIPTAYNTVSLAWSHAVSLFRAGVLWSHSIYLAKTTYA